jgi:ribonuclease J
MKKNDKRRGDELVFLPLGGAGEIGMNVSLYGYGPEASRQWIMVDLGITFPSEAEPGADVILPDLRYIEEERPSLLALVLTHAHEDHFGAVIDLWPGLKVPIYATPFTAALLKAKLAEQRGNLKLPITEIPLGGRFSIGPFDLEYITVAHSIPEPNGLAIRTPTARVFHTGDWKLDPSPTIGAPTDDKAIKSLAAEGLDAVVCDSTNALREGFSPSESEVAARLAEIIKSARQRVVVTTFASNLGRIRAVAEATRAAGRELVVVGRAMLRIIQVGIETGYLPKSFKYLDQRDFGYLERDEVVALATGSQGEARAAMARIADDSHPDVALTRGDLVIFSSRNIPGNEMAIGRVQNGLAEIGCEILTDSEALVHVTGHPRRAELMRMYEWCEPRAAIPVHGEARHLEAHGRLAAAAGVKEIVQARNGTLVRISPGPAEIVDDVPVGRKFRDGKLIVPSDEGPVRERRKLSFVGIAVVSLVVSERGELLADPQLVLDGLAEANERGESLEELVLDAVGGALSSIPKPRRKDIATLEEAARRAARAACEIATGKKPICKVMVTVV